MPDEIKIEPLIAPAPPAPVEPKTVAPQKPAFNWRGLLKCPQHSLCAMDIFKAVKYFYPLTIVLIVAVLFWVMSFLYHNVYLTMTQAEIVTSLKTKVIEESVDFAKFNDIVKKVAAKKALADWPYLDYLSSPYAYGTRTAYPATTGASAPPATSSVPITANTKSTSTQ